MLASALTKKLQQNGAQQQPTAVKGKRKPQSEPAQSENPSKKAKSKFTHKKPLTTEEINTLLESSNNLSNENLFALQIEEIIKSIGIPAKHESFIQTWLRELNEFLANLESDADKTPSDALEWTDNVKIPIDEYGLEIPSFPFQFIAPKSASVIGSHAVSTTVGPAFTIDVAVEIPAKFFQKDNYLNLVYHKKKALYLAYLTLQLQKRSSGEQCKFTFAQDNRFNPIIVLKPKGIRHLLIHVYACTEPNAFKLNRFLPATSNVRSSLFAHQTNGAADELHATPHYNSSVLHDLTMLQNENFLKRMLETTHTNVREAIVLFKLWLRTRGLQHSALGGYLVSMFAVHLLKKRVINAAMSTFDVLRNLWIQFATSRWHESGKGVSLNPEPANSMDTFHFHFDVVFLDVTGYLNLAANLPLDVYLRVRDESSKALVYLTTATIVNFRHLFTNQRPTFLQYDHIINITSDAKLTELAEGDKYVSYYHDYCGQTRPIASHLIAKILRQGFDKRVTSFTPIGGESATWDITSAPPSASHALSFGLILNHEFAIDVLDRGPQADHDEADAFKVFWGDKSELRRFQDGSIVEACVWTAPNAPLSERRMICKSIALHLLAHHFKIAAKHVAYVADQFDVAYQLAAADEEAASNSEHLSLAVVKSLDELGKKLRALANIPLDISSVQGTSPVFRYCGLQPVTPVAESDWNGQTTVFRAYAVNEFVIQLAASGKWPDNLTALQRLKAAFALRIAKELRDNEVIARSNGHHIDVLQNGFLFRIRIAIQKELALIKKTVTNKGVLAYRDTEASRIYERDLLVLPKLTVYLHTLYHQHTSFGPAVMIAKRWLMAQLIDDALWPEVCIELLMARIYLQTDSLAAPVQPQVGFLRWLQLLATADWRTDYVLLNFNDGLSAEQLSKLESQFLNDRDSFPFLTIVSSGGESKEWAVWSSRAPVMELVARVAVLSRHCLQSVEQELFVATGPIVQPLFVAALEGYDVIIKLRRSHMQPNHLAEFTVKSQRYVKPAKVKAVPLADLNMQQLYLNELRVAYDDFALFFHDPNGGDTIAVLWKPSVRIPKEFKTTTVMGCRYDDAEQQYVSNLKQIVEDFRVIGHGLVETVTDVTQLGG